MRVIENGIEREATAEEIAIEKRIQEEDSKHFLTETARDYIEEFLDELAEVKSLTDIIKIAKDIKQKRGK
jgi:hypothetical protein